MRRSRAVITVFFSLLSVIFLGLTFTFVEAVRYRAARAHCADLMTVGNWSVFSGFENRLLEKYDLFGIDASSGGTVSAADLGTRLKSSLDENANVRDNISGKLPGLTFDPFQVSVKDASVTEYALLSDNNGEYFYQQAVDFMHETAWMNALGKLNDSARSAQKAQEAIDDYKTAKKNADKQAADIKAQSSSMESQLQEQAAKAQVSGSSQGSSGNVVILDGSGSGQTASPTPAQSAAQAKLEEKKKADKVKNPLWKMIQLKFKSVLDLVCGSLKVSSQKLPGWTVLSKRSKNKGTLKLDTDRGGVTDDLLFREYLLDHFPDWSSGRKEKSLQYQLEYIIGGSTSDKKNLKKVVNKMILLREAYNYLYLQADAAAFEETSSLAAAILGWTGNPGLVEALREAFLVYWAYGESLYDVRILMHGGKVPLIKTSSDWHVPLNKLYYLETLLKKADRTAGHGEDYSDYLRLLLNMQFISTQKKRGLDLLEIDLRQEEGMAFFQADNCVIAMKDTCIWSISPVFSSVPSVFLGTRFSGGSFQTDSGFAY